MRTPRFIGLLLAGALGYGSSAAAQPSALEPDSEETIATPVASETPTEPAPTATPASAPTPTDSFLTDAGILFSLNNIFVNSAILSSYRGFGVGAQLALTGPLTLRGGFSLSHNSNPVTIRKNTLITGDDRVVTYQLDASSPTATWGTALGVDLIYTLLESSRLSPYVGGGPLFTYSTTATKYKDDLTVPDQVTWVNNEANALRLSLLGILGLSWRVHRHFSLYAEYSLSIALIDWVADSQQTTQRNSVGGVATTTRTRSEAEETRFFHLQLGLTQGASFGLIAHFGAAD